MQGAAAVAANAHGKPAERNVLAFYLLIGFALENGLKAYLQHCGVDKKEKIDRPPLAHDLNRLRALAEGAGLALPNDSIKLIESLAESHLNHHFRYPKNAGIVELFSEPFAYVWTENALATVAHGINYKPD
jgi:hypothetical protein